MKEITILGRPGETFSAQAYHSLSERCGAPALTSRNYRSVNSNQEIVPKVKKLGGYGVIALDTTADGCVSESIVPFVRLLDGDDYYSRCTFKIIGAVRLPVEFCLMARRGATKSSLKGIVAHEKALTACKGNITRLRLLRHAVSNNGEAAQLVSGSEAYKNCGALAPISAAKKFKLRVLDSNFEDKPSVTTFALLAPLEKREVIGTRNRMIVVFRIDDKPGALFDALSVFKTLGINMKQIHSVFTGQGQYDFYIELDVPKEKVDLANAASMRLQVVTTRMLSFGPFELFD